MNNNIEITSNAQEHIAKILENDNSKYFRITVLGGGCAGFQYKFDFDNSKGPKGFPILILTDGRTPLNIISQAFSKPVIPTGSRRVFPVAERKAAPFFAGRRTLDKDVPSGKIPKISPFLSARIEFFIVEGAKLLRSVGINPYINGAQINCVSIT